MQTKYISHEEYFSRVEKDYPRKSNIIKTGPGPVHITVYDKTGEFEPVTIGASEYLREGEALGFVWNG